MIVLLQFERKDHPPIKIEDDLKKEMTNVCLFIHNVVIILCCSPMVIIVYITPRQGTSSIYMS